MRFYFCLIAAAVAALLLGWYATIWATPRVIMQAAQARLVETAGGYNKMLASQPVTPQNQTIVRQAPDLLYSACAYDLTDGPVTITVGATDGYWSASFFDGATNNYQTLNSTIYGEDETLLTLVRAEPGIATRGHTIISPSTKGVVLIRRRILSEPQLQDMLTAQSADRCAPAA